MEQVLRADRQAWQKLAEIVPSIKRTAAGDLLQKHWKGSGKGNGKKGERGTERDADGKEKVQPELRHPKPQANHEQRKAPVLVKKLFQQTLDKGSTEERRQADSGLKTSAMRVINGARNTQVSYSWRRWQWAANLR